MCTLSYCWDQWESGSSSEGNCSNRSLLISMLKVSGWLPLETEGWMERGAGVASQREIRDFQT